MKRIRSLFWATSLVLPFCISCSSAQTQDESKPLVDSKYKLSEDRNSFEELRKDIPVQKRSENDELAYVLQLMSQNQHTPSQVRDKFNTVLRKKRELFQKDMKKKREEFVKAEKKEKDEFLKNIEVERKDFSRNKVSSDQRREFYSDIEAKRKDFFAGQREKRDSFESDMRDSRKNFDDYAREKTSEFNQEHRAYSKKFDEIKKEKEEQKKKGSSAAPTNSSLGGASEGLTNQDIDNAFRSLKDKPAENLEPGQ
jgi:hypothetical protein